MSKVKYGNYINELCCDDCEYAGQYNRGGWCPLEPVNVCPDCGGKLSEHVGRWRYTETQPLWIAQFFVGFGPKTTYHGFEKGRACDKKTSSAPPNRIGPA